MKWSGQQVKAIDAVGRWLSKAEEQVFRLFGYAGVGKTTLAQHLASGAGIVYFAAYTGKAASVMRNKGCNNASTIHSLIYQPADRSRMTLLDLQHKLELLVHEIEQEPEYKTEDAPDVNDVKEVKELKVKILAEQEKLKRPAFVLNPDSNLRGADLVVIDECTMVNERMGDDLLSFEVPILVLGDPAQLPPVMGGGFFTNHDPDVMLTEIHRQAAGNPVIDLATRVRKGESLTSGQYGNSLVMDGKPPEHLVMGADQVLVGRNATRRKCNHKMRRLLGRGQDPLPVGGDKLVCLRNDHEVGLLNGTLWEVTDAEAIPNMELMSLTVEGDGTIVSCSAHTHYFKGIEDKLKYYEIREAQCFDYGYALTTHKAQGSQWPNVFVFDESWVFRQRGASKRWLYTAITRASERVTICRA